MNIIDFYFEDNLLCSTYTEEVIIDKKIAEEIIKKRHLHSAGEKQYWLHDFKKVKFFTKDGRDFTQKNGQEYLHACATLVNSHLNQFIVNLYIKLHNPAIPLRAFTDSEAAKIWLKEIRLRNENRSKIE